MQHAKSEPLLKKQNNIFPAAVNSPVRSFRQRRRRTAIIAGGAGSKLTDIDGNEYIDYVLSYGPLLLGHAHPVVTEPLKKLPKKVLPTAHRHLPKPNLPNSYAALFLPWTWYAW